MNKVTGLLRLKKAQHDNITNIRQNNLNREEDAQPTNKGKSLGKKVNIMKDKHGTGTSKRPRMFKSRVEAQRNYADEMGGEYYEEKWEEEDQEDILIDRRKDKSGLYR